ncbi:DUF202 domain-containing protein [Streptomyces sp. AC563]|uniref:YidH family protein n=1 Tax=Streptomyces buecherae TaxID=2763006 RepID=UPI00164D193D|nr:DUF202 domain-containing protein [Streptomyces buecherae]MBC3993475.1 DUF202 domain-containing protein [Streptomyces buecherae]
MTSRDARSPAGQAPGGPGRDREGAPAGRRGRWRAARAEVGLWWAPAQVRAEGQTPDYRFSLANERTFLAWLRTALALIGGGFAVDQFLPDQDRPLRTVLAIALLVGGALCALRAVNHWLRCERAMRRGDDLPISRFPTVLALAVGLMSVVMVLVVALGGAG